MDVSLQVAGTFLGLCVTAWVSYKIAVRKNSGNIDTTEAGVLWEERRLLSQELRDEIAVVRQENNTLKAENTKMRELVEKQYDRLDSQDKTIVQLEDKIKKFEEAQ